MYPKLLTFIKDKSHRTKSVPLSAILVMSVFIIGTNYKANNQEKPVNIPFHSIIANYNEKKAAYSQNKINLAALKNTLQKSRISLRKDPDNFALKKDINRTMKLLEQAYLQKEATRIETDSALHAVIELRKNSDYTITYNTFK